MKKYSLAFIFSLVTGLLSAQNFSMYGKTPLMINPAFTGIQDYGRLNLIANTLRLTDLKYTNSYIGYGSYFSKLHGALGVYNANRIIGKFSRESIIGLSYAYQGQINQKWNYSIGGTANLRQYVMNWDALGIYCINPCPFGLEKNNYFNISLGGVIYSDKWFLAYSGAEIGFSQFSYVKSNINLGRTFKFKKVEDLALTTGLFVSILQSGFSHVELQTLLQYKRFYFGAKYAESDSYAFQLGLDVDRFRINYNFSSSTSMLTTTKYLYHEISLQIKLPKSIDRKSKAFNHLIY